MSWIQENRFAAGLGGVTAIAAIGLIAWSVSQGSAYSAAKASYDEAAEKISAMEGSRLYPNDENLRGKKLALADYYNNVEKLQKSFDAYRPTELPLVEPSVFTEELKKVKGEIDQALSASNVETPPQFYLGFETYTQSAAQKGATGILGYELGGVAELFKALAASKPEKVNNVYRVPLEEESGATFDSKDKAFRPLSLELTFTGTEASVRSFLSALDDSKKYYYVIRSMKVANTVEKAPTAADAVFEKPAETGAAAPADDGGFQLPPADGEPAAPAAPEATPGAAAGADTGKILQQVLGSEKVHVFLRIDILQFLSARELPKP